MDSQNIDLLLNLTKPHISREQIESLVGFRVRNVALYQRALVHKSIQKYFQYIDKTKVPEYMLESNERLEFVGDSVLGTITAIYLHHKFKGEDEGFLTQTRSKIVRGKTLAKIATSIGLGNYLLISPHVESINGRQNPNLLENAFEALLGAIYEDFGGVEEGNDNDNYFVVKGKGFEYASRFFFKLLKTHVDESEIFENDNYKDILLKYCQSNENNFELPVYNVINMDGPSHNKTFTVEVVINGTIFGTGVGKKKQSAEQNAASIAVSKLGILN